MELWIRSQGKMMLRKIDNAFIDDRTICTYSGDDAFILGEYATKERALEVLDEIQQALQQGFVIDKTTEEMTTVGAIIHNNSDAIVFEMPKD